MKPAWLVASMVILLVTACESTDDVLNRIDHTVPSVQFAADTLEVDPGGTVLIQAVVEDESGIQRIEFTYGDWRINHIIDLREETGTESYSFSLEIEVPRDARKEWEENKYFNDASSIKIIQRYHKLALSVWDKNRNLSKTYCYIKVK